MRRRSTLLAALDERFARAVGVVLVNYQVRTARPVERLTIPRRPGGGRRYRRMDTALGSSGPADGGPARPGGRGPHRPQRDIDARRQRRLMTTPSRAREAPAGRPSAARRMLGVDGARRCAAAQAIGRRRGAETRLPALGG
jgi:hypothetical protein